MTNKNGYYKKIKRQQLQKIMEVLKNHYFIMARTVKAKDFSGTCIRMSTRLRLISVTLGSKCNFRTAFEHNRNYKENLQSKTVSTTTYDSREADWETGRRCRDEQSLSPQQNPAVGCHKAQKLRCQYLSLTPTNGHLLSLPWLMRSGAALAHTPSYIFFCRIRVAFPSAGSLTGHFQVVSSTAKYDLLANMHVRAMTRNKI